MLEIERVFLCRIEDEAVLRRAGPASIIRQGYLTERDPAVRVRRRDGAWTLTVKSGAGRVRREVEVAIDAARGTALMEMAGERTVEKARRVAGRWEVDVYRGRFDGLVTAEVELEREDEPLPDPPPGVAIGREVTDELRFTNQQLSRLDEDEARALVREVAD